MTKQNNNLTKLPNIGNALAHKLNVVGIITAEDLISLGTENTFIKLKTIDNDICINTLYAIEGAIQGIRWHDLDRDKKREIQEFFKMTKK